MHNVLYCCKFQNFQLQVPEYSRISSYKLRHFSLNLLKSNWIFKNLVLFHEIVTALNSSYKFRKITVEISNSVLKNISIYFKIFYMLQDIWYISQYFKVFKDIQINLSTFHKFQNIVYFWINFKKYSMIFFDVFSDTSGYFIYFKILQILKYISMYFKIYISIYFRKLHILQNIIHNILYLDMKMMISYPEEWSIENFLLKKEKKLS